MELISVGCIEAFKESSPDVFSILSTLCFFYRRPFKLRQVIIFDKKHDVQIYTQKFCPTPEILAKPRCSFKASPISSLFVIYREAMNSVDIPYRYISLFKIYEAWYEHSEKFFRKEERAKITLTSNLFVSFYHKKHHEIYLNKNFDNEDLYKVLRQIRNYLVHPFLDRNVPPSFAHLDTLESLEFIESMSNLVERIATKILDEELRVMEIADKDVAALLENYHLNNSV